MIVAITLQTTYVLELDHSQLYSLINELDSVDRVCLSDSLFTISLQEELI